MKPPSVSLVLPVNTDANERGSDLKRVAERLLPSIARHCSHTFVKQIIIIAKEPTIATAALAESKTLLDSAKLELKIVNESDLIEISALRGDSLGSTRDGWYLQQLLKLEASRIVDTPIYMTLDSDIVFIRPFTENTVFSEGKAPYQGTTSHAGNNFGKRSNTNAEILEMESLTRIEEPFTKKTMRATPQFLVSRIVQELIDHLQIIARRKNHLSWTNYLWEQRNQLFATWTEYSLYWTYFRNRYSVQDFYIETARNNDLFAWFENSDALEKANLSNLNRVTAPFSAVAQSSKIGDTRSLPFEMETFKKVLSKKYPELGFDLNTADLIAPDQIRRIFCSLGHYRTWQVSFGGVGSNFFAKSIMKKQKQKYYDLICHFPYPLRLDADVRAIYVYGDVYESVLSQISTGEHRVNIAKNSNACFPASAFSKVNINDYIGSGRDLLNLEDHFNNWARPDDAVDFPIAFVRFEAIERNIGEISDFLRLSDRERTNFRESFQIRKRRSKLDDCDSRVVNGLRALYSDFQEYLNDFPDYSIRNPNKLR